MTSHVNFYKHLIKYQITCWMQLRNVKRLSSRFVGPKIFYFFYCLGANESSLQGHMGVRTRKGQNWSFAARHQHRAPTMSTMSRQHLCWCIKLCQNQVSANMVECTETMANNMEQTNNKIETNKLLATKNHLPLPKHAQFEALSNLTDIQLTSNANQIIRAPKQVTFIKEIKLGNLWCFQVSLFQFFLPIIATIIKQGSPHDVTKPMGF